MGAVVISTACGSGGGSLFGQDKPTPPAASDAGTDASFVEETPDVLAGCASETKKATPLPLDLVLMLDTSSSMGIQVATGISKYYAVRTALASFVADPSSAGIGIGLSFFPTPKSGTPETCTTNAACAASGSGGCSLRACNQPGQTVWCDGPADCTGGAACLVIGRCAKEPSAFCYPGAACGNDFNGFDQGTCVAQTTGVCVDSDSCTISDYAVPKVAIAPLPASANAITSALAAKSPDGATPTSAALEGAVTAASNYAKANPGHSVIAVLATDGLPTECDSSLTSIANIAKNAYTGSPSVKTFVVGVFAASEATTAKSNLDLIAQSGGTQQAFVVTQGATTTQQFVDAMTAIRGAALPCEYDVPVPASGQPDFGKINVVYTPANGKKSLFPNKTNAAGCGGQAGWYYDVDPNKGTPKKIILCPTTCDAIHASNGQVDVVIGCVTQVN